jgi:hypothetical protein
MKAISLGALLVLTAACGAYQFPASPSPHTGMVSGHIIVVPCGPVEPAGFACVGRPAAGLEIDFVDGKVVKSTVADQNGDYAVQLSPATYQVQFKNHMRIVKGPNPVTVTEDSKVVADYVLDSGIRFPAPQQ